MSLCYFKLLNGPIYNQVWGILTCKLFQIYFQLFLHCFRFESVFAFHLISTTSYLFFIEIDFIFVFTKYFMIINCYVIIFSSNITIISCLQNLNCSSDFIESRIRATVTMQSRSISTVLHSDLAR
jgi:hypothetical protein